LKANDGSLKRPAFFILHDSLQDGIGGFQADVEGGGFPLLEGELLDEGPVSLSGGGEGSLGDPGGERGEGENVVAIPIGEGVESLTGTEGDGDGDFRNRLFGLGVLDGSPKGRPWAPDILLQKLKLLLNALFLVDFEILGLVFKLLRRSDASLYLWRREWRCGRLESPCPKKDYRKDNYPTKHQSWEIHVYPSLSFAGSTDSLSLYTAQRGLRE
jgi:hypothetical protein